MQRDVPLRAVACAIYDACYPTEDWAPSGFDEAERLGTIHYLQAVAAAQLARIVLARQGEQLRARGADGVKLPKMMLGAAGGGAVMLSPDWQVESGLGISEGIETGLAGG